VICVIRANSYTKKSQYVRFYVISDMFRCGSTPSSVRAAFIEHFETTQGKHRFSFYSVVSKCSIKAALIDDGVDPHRNMSEIT
jgi:hypothetical protein